MEVIFNTTKKHPELNQFLLVEYQTVAEHFRTYQKIRLNIELLAIPAIGALMLQCLKEDALMHGLCIVMLYLILIFAMRIDNFFMKRLRNYTIHLRKIEKVYGWNGHATKRIKNPAKHEDATTNTIRTILYMLDFFILLYVILTFSVTVMKEFPSLQNFHPEIIWYYSYIIPFFICFIFFIIIKHSITTKGLPEE